MNNLQKYKARNTLVEKLAESERAKELLKGLKKDKEDYKGSQILMGIPASVAAGVVLGAASNALTNRMFGLPLSKGMGKAMLGTGISLGLTRGLGNVLQDRAALGRAAQGKQGLNKDEDQVLEAIRKSRPEDKATNPFSRFFTNPATAAGMGAITGAATGARGAIIGGLGAGGLMTLQRIANARAAKGRARTEGSGTHSSDTKIQDAIRAARASV